MISSPYHSRSDRLGAKLFFSCPLFYQDYVGYFSPLMIMLFSTIQLTDMWHNMQHYSL